MLTVLATSAEDKLVDETGAALESRNGGPAFFISAALQKENVEFSMISPPVLSVDILLKDGEEFGKMNREFPSMQVDFSSIKTPFLLISSVLDDFDLSNISEYKGQIFLDAQGYVRNGVDFGKKKEWVPSKNITSNIVCLKCTKQESQFIPLDFMDMQKNKILLMTEGRNGCTVFENSASTQVPAETVIGTRHTIGAGDTFFAYFISSFIKGKKVTESVKYATRLTAKFIRQNQTPHRDEMGGV